VIFEALNRAALESELLLVRGGMCHFHLRRDGQLTIREIIVLPECQRRGIATRMLDRLRAVRGASSIFAKCPADLPANGWYRRMGFSEEGREITKGGTELIRWRLTLSTAREATPDSPT